MNLPEKDRERLGNSRPRLLQEDGFVEDVREPVENTFELAEEPSVIPGDAEILEESFEGYEPQEAEPKEAEPQSWRQTRWGALYFFLAIGVLGGIAYFATHYESDMALEKIKVEGAHQLSDQEIISLARIDRKQKFYDIDLHAIAERIEKHSLIKAAYPRRETNPATIVLSVTERQPAAIMRSANGEMLLIDNEGQMIRPKKLEGLRNPSRLLQVPLISGISEKDSVSYRAMTRMVLHIQSLDSGALQDAIGELHRTPTGGYLLYTLDTRTPIFLGSQSDRPFVTSTEATLASTKNAVPKASLFDRQLHLLAIAWRGSLKHDIEAHPPLYVDARYEGEIILKKKGIAGEKFSMPHIAKDSTRSIAMVLNTNARPTKEQSVLQHPMASGMRANDRLQSVGANIKTSNSN